MAAIPQPLEAAWRKSINVLANRTGFESPGWALTFSVVCGAMTWTMIPMGISSLLEIPLLRNLILTVPLATVILLIIKWLLLTLGSLSSAICFAKFVKICFPEYYGD